MSDLIETGSVRPAVAALITGAIRARLNVAIIGPTFSGRTALLRAALLESSSADRWYCLESGRGELGLADNGHDNVIELSATDGSVDSPLPLVWDGRIALDDDRRPNDVRALMTATSCRGSWCVLHARSAQEALQKLLLLCGYAPGAAAGLVGGWLDIIVCMGVDNRPDGSLRRFVTAVDEVAGRIGATLASTEVCAPTRNGLAVPSRPLSARTAARLAEVGYVHLTPLC